MRSLLIAAIAVIAFLSFAQGFYRYVATAVPKLVGTGCEGSSGTLYADEESDFPVCRRIETNPIRVLT